MIILNQKEIAQRLIRLRNLEQLHKKARKRVVLQDKEIKKLKTEVATLKQENQTLKQTVQYLMLQMEEIKKKVFGKKKNKDKDDKPSKEKQKTDRSSSSYQRPIPEETKTENHSIDNCSICSTPLKRKRTVIYFEEDILLEKLKEVIKHMVEQGYCEKCKKWVSAIPLPSAKCIIGQKLRKYICYLSIIQRLSHQQIENHIKDIYKINISQGEINKIFEKEANKLRPEFERLKKRIQKQFAHHYDETSWKVNKGGQGNFAWIMAGTETNETVFSLGKSRGKGNVNDLNPKTEIGITDDYGAYKNQFKEHQLCWAHLYRKFKDLKESDILNEKQKEICLNNYQTISNIYKELKETLKIEFEYEKTHKYFLQKLEELFKPNTDDIPKLKTIKESLFKNKEKYLTCLKFPGLVPMDNNKAERGLRHLVIKRKISYGSKTDRGAETTSILASVLLSLKWQNPNNFFQKYLSLKS
ncbi:MAG: IS66 family transposase [bacterium]